MTDYIGTYKGESGHMMDTLEELDGFLWTNSLENTYKVIHNTNQRSWYCQSDGETIETITGAFPEIEFTAGVWCEGCGLWMENIDKKYCEQCLESTT